jgi:hypothetical protein
MLKFLASTETGDILPPDEPKRIDIHSVRRGEFLLV